MDGKANKEVSKSAVDREKGKRGGEGTDGGKERNRKDNGREQERTPHTSAVTCFWFMAALALDFM